MSLGCCSFGCSGPVCSLNTHSFYVLTTVLFMVMGSQKLRESVLTQELKTSRGFVMNPYVGI